MREAGWFQYIRGMVIGRVAVPSCFYKDFSYQDALKNLFPDIPLIFNADIGHVPPKMTIINGSIAHIICKNGKGAITQTLWYNKKEKRGVVYVRRRIRKDRNSKGFIK